MKKIQGQDLTTLVKTNQGPQQKKLEENTRSGFVSNKENKAKTKQLEGNTKRELNT